MGQIILKFMFSIVILGAVTVIGLTIREIYNTCIETYYRKTLRYETVLYNGVVVNQKYVEYTGIEKYIFEKEYNTYIKIPNKEYCIDDKKTYQKLKIGDVSQICIHNCYNENNELKNTYICVKD